MLFENIKGVKSWKKNKNDLKRYYEVKGSNLNP
jgi:hypothetical protein